MSEQIIKLSDSAAARIKEIMSNADGKTIGVRVGVKTGGCAGTEIQCGCITTSLRCTK